MRFEERAGGQNREQRRIGIHGLTRLREDRAGDAVARRRDHYAAARFVCGLSVLQL